MESLLNIVLQEFAEFLVIYGGRIVQSEAWAA